ncbi:MAG: cyclohexanecarboxylate-CoA ligase [Caulobacter sp.]|nr:cyclohexanecarboxylate-CoA ligase [Caulobacter sp.]
MAFEAPEAVQARWRAEGLLAGKTLAQAFADAVAARPGARVSIISDIRPANATLAEVHERARRVAAGLSAEEIGPGDIVAVQTPNWLETVVAHAALALLGAVALPIVHIYGKSEVDYILRQSRAKAIVTPDCWRGANYIERVADLREGLPDLKHIVVGRAPAGDIAWDALAAHPPLETLTAGSPGDLALLIYTSGTTSDPKGVQHSHATLLAELMAAPERDPDEVSLSPWPPGHVAGVLGLGRFWLMGRSSVLMERWDAPEAARLIEAHRISGTSGTPFHLTSLLDAAEAAGNDLSSLTDYLAGATMIPPALIARCQAMGLRTYRSYGLSEHPTVSRGGPDDPLEKRLGTDGRLCPGVEVRIVDDEGHDVAPGGEGEILSRGPERFLGYFDPALNDGVLVEGGWLRTGDIGRLDAEGYLAITDRKKDIIIRGGENIASREVEDILMTLPGVKEAAVVGMPHPTLGEKVCAFIVADPAAGLCQEKVSAHFKASGVARQKTPEKVVLIEELPRNAAGKVLKPMLREMLRAG